MDFVRDSKYVIFFEAYIMHLDVAWRIVVITVITLAATLIVSVFLAIFRFHRFRISLDGDKLQVTRGLVNTHLAEVKLKNITGIRIEDNPLRQAMGTSTVYLDCISSSAEENSSTLLMPWIRRKDISGILSSIFPQWDLSILHKKHSFSIGQRIYRVPYKGFLSFFIVKLLAVGGIALCTYALFMHSRVALFWILVAASIVLSMLWSFLQYKDHFFILNHAKQLSISKRFISRTTVLVNRSSIQQIDYVQTPLQASRKLRDIVITLRTSAFKKKYRIKYLHDSSCKPLYSWLGLRHK
ncbi:Bacterial membrane flanked domain protein [compost metagenome]